MNVRDAFYEVLRAHGITTIFGNPTKIAFSIIHNVQNVAHSLRRPYMG